MWSSDCKGSPIPQASSWAESGHRCIGVLKDNSANLRADPIRIWLSQCELWRSRLFRVTKTAHPWRHFCVFASHLSHFTACCPACSSIHWSSRVGGSLWLTRLYPASLSCNMKFKSSFLCAVSSSASQNCPVPRRMANENYFLFTQIWYSFPFRRIMKSL